MRVFCGEEASAIRTAQLGSRRRSYIDIDRNAMFSAFELLRLQADERNPGMNEFGELISAKRKSLAMSQRELAAKVKKEDGKPISIQYLNDIEHGRRNPPSSEHLMEQFAKALRIPRDRLMITAGYLPSDIVEPIKRLSRTDPDKAETVLRAFRKKLDDLNR